VGGLGVDNAKLILYSLHTGKGAQSQR
jgi:hypothetical protein